MQLTALRRPLQRVAVSSCRHPIAFSWTCLSERLAQLSLGGAAVEGRRFASVKAQGAYKIPNKKTLPKKMGAKKTGDQFVIPGNIIYKQRGTIWHPGENTIMGRDHTIHAAITGYVKFYRDPARHPTRQYIGVTFNRNDTLPYPPGNPRQRRLGLVAVPRKVETVESELMSPSGIPRWVVRKEDPEEAAAAKAVAEAEAAAKAALRDVKTKKQLELDPSKLAGKELRLYQELEEIKAQAGTRVLRLQKDYSYRETNWEIGRLVGPVGRVAGTEKLISRKAKLRLWRKKRFIYFARQKVDAKAKKERVMETMAQVKRVRAIRARERRELLAEEREKKVKAAADDEAKLRESEEKKGGDS